MSINTNTYFLLLKRLRVSILRRFNDLPRNTFLSLEDFEKEYTDTPEYQYLLSKGMKKQLLADVELYNYRKFIKENVYGMGEDEFLILWKLIVNSMPEEFSFCEIGVHKGQILALINLLSKRENKKVCRYGVSPMNGINTRDKGNFHDAVQYLHKRFNLDEDYFIIEGLSEEPSVITKAEKRAPFDILYIDGSHERSNVEWDFMNYLPMLAKNGILVVDDSNNNARCTYGPPFLWGGRFWGIPDVSDVTDYFMSNNKAFKFVGSIIHNRVWRKIN